ncbi:MAG TPA: hypothetical protein DCO77_01540, partial [Nitrospiraceae bacterium]|nr:hypothetical protein [Nitrospiraceae bacterium]
MKFIFSFKLDRYRNLLIFMLMDVNFSAHDQFCGIEEIYRLSILDGTLKRLRLGCPPDGNVIRNDPLPEKIEDFDMCPARPCRLPSGKR